MSATFTKGLIDVLVNSHADGDHTYGNQVVPGADHRHRGRTRACDSMLGLGLDVDVIVPGHGPIIDKAGLREFRDYLAYVEAEATRMHARGLDVMQAARAIDLTAYAHWTDAERIALAVDTIYRELAGETGPRDRIGLFARMGELDEIPVP